MPIQLQTAAASLGNAGVAKFGTSYTYMQITMSRAYTVQGSAEDSAKYLLHYW